MKLFLLLICLVFVSKGSFAFDNDFLEKYFDGRCGLVNKAPNSQIEKACHVEKISYTPTYKATPYLVLFTKKGAFEYTLSDFKFLNVANSKASVVMTNPETKKSALVTMNWYYYPASYPGESLESLPLSLKGVSPEGDAFDFSDLVEFYNGTH